MLVFSNIISIHFPTSGVYPVNSFIDPGSLVKKLVTRMPQRARFPSGLNFSQENLEKTHTHKTWIKLPLIRRPTVEYVYNHTFNINIFLQNINSLQCNEHIAKQKTAIKRPRKILPHRSHRTICCEFLQLI